MKTTMTLCSMFVVAMMALEISDHSATTFASVSGVNAFMAAASPDPGGGHNSGRRHVSNDYDMKLSEKETIKKSFTLSGAAVKELDVNNVFGSIEVVGGSSNEIQVVVTKTIRAESQAKLELARKEVTLDTGQKDNAVTLYVNGPFRCSRDGCIDCDRSEGYIVQMDFQIQVPNQIQLRLKTVNDGDIKVRGVSGDYKVNNVNGEIEMLDMIGSGHVSTVNGAVKVTFRENPLADSEFSSINGNVELVFTPSLSADFRFKTFNGDVYSDYQLTSLPQKAGSAERRDGKFVFQSDRSTGGRIGSGGPEIKVENLNGDIRILEHHV